MYLLHTGERDNAALKDNLETTTSASSASAPSTAPPLKFIAAVTTTGRDEALIAALTAQSVTQAVQTTKLLAALTAGRRDNVRRDGGKKRRDSGCGDGKPNPNYKYIARIASELSLMKQRNANSWRATQQPALTGGNSRYMASLDTRRGWKRKLNKYLLT